MYRRKSPLFLAYVGIGVILIFLMFIHARSSRSASADELEKKRRFVEQFEITDLCLFTDARYTRHPSMADLHTPFQDYPVSLEHFPSGSLMSPPPHLKSHGID